MASKPIDISRLSPAERLQLVEELWDSLATTDIPLTPAQADELDRREGLHRLTLVVDDPGETFWTKLSTGAADAAFVA